MSKHDATSYRPEGKSRTFHLGDILSITTERLVSPRHMEGVYDILNFMTGDNLFTHQLPRAADQCRPYLLEQLPRLAGIQVAPDFEFRNQAHVDQWLRQQVAEYGERHPVKPLPLADRVHLDPVSELMDMVGEDRVIVVETDGIA